MNEPEVSGWGPIALLAVFLLGIVGIPAMLIAVHKSEVTSTYAGKNYRLMSANVAGK